MPSAGAVSTAPADNSFIARRELFDALSAGGGVLEAGDLQRAVEPYLLARVGGEVGLAGGIAAYLDAKIELFRTDGMIDVDGGRISLTAGYELWEPSSRHPTGRVLYVAGTQREIDYAREMDSLILASRRRLRSAWDCLLPQSDSKQRIETIRKSFSTFGWDAARPVIKDRTGTVIDGRMRLEELKRMFPDGPIAPNGSKKSWNAWEAISANVRMEVSLTPASGVVRSFDENRDRCSDFEVEQYLERLTRMGIDFERLRIAVGVVARLDTSGLDGSPLQVMILPSGIQVTTDGQFVQLRSLVAGPRPLQVYDAKPLRNYLADHGYTVMSRKTHSPFSNGKGTMGRVADFGSLEDLISLMAEDGGSALEAVWPQSPGKHKVLIEKLQMLRDVPGEIDRVIKDHAS